jgi:RimJ/RimL family protein N-acetyltransferase
LIPELRTERLLLRGWRAEDREPFAEMSADPESMRHYPALLTRTESDARVDAYEAEWEQSGFGKWAVEIPGVAPFAGSIGLGTLTFEASFTPCVEIGWRLAPAFWSRGYATEGARAALEFGFQQLGLAEIVAFTTPANTRSLRVMEKLGMSLSGEFDHPMFADGHRVRKHLLYRIGREGTRMGAPLLPSQEH